MFSRQSSSSNMIHFASIVVLSICCGLPFTQASFAGTTDTYVSNNVVRNISSELDLKKKEGSFDFANFKDGTVALKESIGDKKTEAEVRIKGGKQELWIKENQKWRKGTAEDEKWLQKFFDETTAVTDDLELDNFIDTESYAGAIGRGIKDPRSMSRRNNFNQFIRERALSPDQQCTLVDEMIENDMHEPLLILIHSKQFSDRAHDAIKAKLNDMPDDYKQEVEEALKESTPKKSPAVTKIDKKVDLSDQSKTEPSFFVFALAIFAPGLVVMGLIIMFAINRMKRRFGK